MYTLLNLMAEGTIRLSQTVSVLGYSMLPMLGLAALAILPILQYVRKLARSALRSLACFFPRGFFGVVVAAGAVAWCTMSASGMFVSVLNMHGQRALVVYPCAIIYGLLALFAVF
jgi:protein YIPF5/7